MLLLLMVSECVHTLLFRRKGDERNDWSKLFIHWKILLRYLYFNLYCSLKPFLTSVLNFLFWMITSSSDQTLEYRKLSLISSGLIDLCKGFKHVFGELINEWVYLRGGYIIRLGEKALRNKLWRCWLKHLLHLPVFNQAWKSHNKSNSFQHIWRPEGD